VAQEVVKVTGKFTPLPGWFHFHVIETLPDDAIAPPAKDQCDGSRYGDLMHIFGAGFPEKLQNNNYFMVL
jgi:ubiquitin-activating enzyme E1